jgi:hypothetical protein
MSVIIFYRVIVSHLHLLHVDLKHRGKKLMVDLLHPKGSVSPLLPLFFRKKCSTLTLYKAPHRKKRTEVWYQHSYMSSNTQNHDRQAT